MLTKAKAEKLAPAPKAARARKPTKKPGGSVREDEGEEEGIWTGPAAGLGAEAGAGAGAEFGAGLGAGIDAGLGASLGAGFGGPHGRGVDGERPTDGLGAETGQSGGTVPNSGLVNGGLDAGSVRGTCVRDRAATDSAPLEPTSPESDAVLAVLEKACRKRNRADGDDASESEDEDCGREPAEDDNSGGTDGGCGQGPARQIHAHRVPRRAGRHSNERRTRAFYETAPRGRAAGSGRGRGKGSCSGRGRGRADGKEASAGAGRGRTQRAGGGATEPKGDVHASQAQKKNKNRNH